MGNAAQREAQLGILAPERDRLEVCGEIMQREREKEEKITGREARWQAGDKI